VACCRNILPMIVLHSVIKLGVILKAVRSRQEAYPFADICCITETLKDCVNGGYSSAFTVAALATVIQHPIGSVYPPDIQNIYIYIYTYT